MYSTAAFLALAFAIQPVAALAQEGERLQLSVSIPAQRLSDALRQLAEATGLQLVYDTKITDGKSSAEVNGVMSSHEALKRLLAGSGLTIQFPSESAAIITVPATTPVATDPGVRSVGVVSVEGSGANFPFGDMASAVNGVNGSRDVETTEATNSYTTGAASIVSKIPQTLRETAQTVSVLTSQRIEDQSLVTLKDLLEKAPGITVTTGGNTEEFQFSSRGFNITTFTFDGGAPVSFNFNNRPVVDFSQYDSVQIIRGANGTFGGYNDPGGTVNLVRKKPLDHKQFSFEQDIGSFSNFRSEIDVTGPITADGKLRARLVASRVDKEYFYDVANAHKTSLYGIAEYDLTPTTLVTIGASHVREDNVPNQGGLPRYADGGEIDFPRSTCLCVPWAYEHPRRTEIFGSIDQRIGSNITARLNASYSKQNVNALYINSSATVVRGGRATGGLGGYSANNPVRQWAIDFYTSGRFTVLNREVEVVIGGNYNYNDNSGGETTFYPSQEIPDIFNFDPYAYPQPAKPDPYLNIIKNMQTIYGAYASFKIEPFKNLKVSAAWRYNNFRDAGIFKYSFSDDPSVSPPLRDKSLSSPNLGVTFDFLNDFTLYGSFQRTYQPQTNARFTVAPGQSPPPPVTGTNKEIGIKWARADGRINASISGYKITQNNFLTTDFTQPDRNVPLLQDITSEGIDAELAGEVVKNLQVSLSYSYNKNRYTSENFQRPQSSYTPRHIVKTWATYRAAPGSWLSGLILGGGVNYQSGSFSQGFICPDPPSSDPNASCSQPFQPFAFTTKAYATGGLKIGYQLSRNVELSVIADNITDAKTYGSNPGQNIVGYNYYIQPRTVTGSVRMKW